MSLPGPHLPVANGGYSFKYWIAKSQGDNGVAGGGVGGSAAKIV